MNDLDRQVAEILTKQGADWAWRRKPHVFHCNRQHALTDTFCRDCGCRLSTEGRYEKAVPIPFSTSLGAAWKLLEHLPYIVTFYFNADRWNCQVQRDLKVYEGSGETKMVALCKVFIEAMGGEK